MTFYESIANQGTQTQAVRMFIEEVKWVTDTG